MIQVRSRVLVLAAVAACSTSPFGSSVPGIEFSTTPAVVEPGGTVHLSLSNSSFVPIAAVVPCPLILQRWSGSAWVGKPDGIDCAMTEETIAPGARYDRAKTIDSSAVAGTYRAGIMIAGRGGNPTDFVYSTSFTVMQ
jgi:hypothetical protein